MSSATTYPEIRVRVADVVREQFTIFIVNGTNEDRRLRASYALSHPELWDKIFLAVFHKKPTCQGDSRWIVLQINYRGLTVLQDCINGVLRIDLQNHREARVA